MLQEETWVICFFPFPQQFSSVKTTHCQINEYKYPLVLKPCMKRLWVLPHSEVRPEWIAKIDHSTSAGDFLAFKNVAFWDKPQDGQTFQPTCIYCCQPSLAQRERGPWASRRRVHGTWFCNIDIFSVVVNRTPQTWWALHPMLIHVTTSLHASVDNPPWILLSCTF